jgi:hypothetical protein
MENYKVAVFGAGFVGIPTASVLALQNPSIEVPILIEFSLSFSISTLTELKSVKRANPQFTSQDCKK